MLDAKLVSEEGFAMSVCSEPIENDDGSYDKQDCGLEHLYGEDPNAWSLPGNIQIRFSSALYHWLPPPLLPPTSLYLRMHALSLNSAD